MRIIYIADDGTWFDNEFECDGYELLCNLSEDHLEFYNANGELMSGSPFYIYHCSEKIVIPDEVSLEHLHKIANFCGWCEWDRIDSIGTWVWKDTTPDSRIANEHFVKEV